jgi:ATP-dependent helicase/nuclease subunit A
LGREKGRYCFGLSIRDPQRGYQGYRHPQYEMLRRLDRYRQTAEEKRLLYVALTRARERLVLIGRKSGRPSYARWLREADAETSMAPLTLRPLDRSRKSAGRDSGTDEPVAAVPSPIPTKDAGAAERRRRPDSTSDGWSKTTWTPTEIVSYYRCPRSFFHSRVEGRTEAPATGWRASPSALVGSAVHELLENQGALGSEAEVERFLDRWRARLDPVYSEVEIRRMSRRIEESLEGVRKCRLTERLASARRVFSEKRFHLLEQGRLVTGIIDKLFQERNGRWVVVDFKTSPLIEPEDGQGIVERGYRLQVQLYLWAVSRVLETMNLEGHLLFTEAGTLRPVPFDAGVAARCRGLIGGLPSTPDLGHFPRTQVSETCSGCGFKTGRVCPGAAVPHPD